MTTIISRKQVVARARKYIGTPFVHQGRALGRGVDCVGLVLCVAEDLGLLDTLGKAFKRSDYGAYGRQPVNEFIYEECERRLQVIAPTGGIIPSLLPGDVLCLRVPAVACHLAIVTALQGGLGIVHAYAGAGKVVEHTLDAKWIKRIAGVFSFPGITNG
jgi:cell wall-associated NlpC family hydrolase